MDHPHLTHRPVRVRLGFPFTNDDRPRTARLEITDETSGIELAEIELDAAALLEYLSGSYAHALARMPRDLSRIGLRCVVVSVRLGLHRVPGEAWTKEEVAAHAEELKVAKGWDTVAWSRLAAGAGYQITGRRWVPAEDAPDATGETA